MWTRSVGLISAFMVGCGGQAGTSSTDDEPPLAQEPREVVQFGFEPTDRERTLIAGLARKAREELSANHLAVTIDRFGEVPGRFFIFIIPPPDTRSGSVHFGLGLLDGEIPQLSELFDTMIAFGPSGPSVEKFVDLDADGQTDVLYCVPDDANDGGRIARALGFRDRAWYALEVRAVEDRHTCDKPL